MWFKIVLLSVLTVVSAVAETPLSKSGPYPAAGWRPNKPFNLPGDFQPPTEVGQQQQKPDKVDVEINKENVNFAGQIQGNSLVTSSDQQSGYLPPNLLNNNDFLKVQGLPHQNTPKFNEQEPELERQLFISRPLTQQQQQDAQFHFRRLQKPKQAQQQLAQHSKPKPPQPGAQSEQQFFPESQRHPRPAQQYGAPENVPANVVYPDPRNQQEDNDDEEEEVDNRTAIEALNAAVDAYNRGQMNRNAGNPQANSGDEDYNDESNAGYPKRPAIFSRSSQGQYYVLGPDNKLQRVMFTTSQDEHDARTNGFTAQLKYTPVAEIRDPVFKYNNRGQMVRVFKK